MPAMRHARIIVFEKTGRWAVALRRELSGQARVYETRSLPDCWDELAVSPASWLVLEATQANLERLAERLAELGSRFSHARAMICGDRTVAEYEWLLREAGAVYAVFSRREFAPAARMALRHLAAAPRPEQSIRDRVWESLPWAR